MLCLHVSHSPAKYRSEIGISIRELMQGIQHFFEDQLLDRDLKSLIGMYTLSDRLEMLFIIGKLALVIVAALEILTRY